jgi:hypothetical protein
MDSLTESIYSLTNTNKRFTKKKQISTALHAGAISSTLLILNN